MAESSGIENAVDARGKPEFVHQIGGTQMLLIGRKEHLRPLRPQRGEVVQQCMVEAGIVFEPVVDQRSRIELRSNRTKNLRQPRLQRIAAGDDIGPVSFEECPLQHIQPQPEIALQMSEKRQAIARSAMNQYAIDIDHQDFHAGCSQSIKCGGKVPLFAVAFKVASHPFFLMAMHVSLCVNIT